MCSQLESDDVLGGAWPEVTPASRDDIRDELADHLACAAAEFETRGLTREQATEQARTAFGDVRAIAQQLYWLHHGRRIMAQRVIMGALVVVCAAAAVVALATYQRSADTAAAVEDLRNQLEAEAAPVDAPVRIELRGADGVPLVGREVYIWPRKVEGPFFVVPDRSSMWSLGDGKRNAERTQINLPEAYELFVTDENGMIDLGRRPPGMITAAISITPELLADGWANENDLKRQRELQVLIRDCWIGYAHKTIEIDRGTATTLMLRLPALTRTAVRLSTSLNIKQYGDGSSIWTVVRGDIQDTTIWLRGRASAGEVENGVAQVELPLPPQPTVYMAYYQWHKDRGNVPAAIEVPLQMTPGEVPVIELPAPIDSP